YARLASPRHLHSFPTRRSSDLHPERYEDRSTFFEELAEALEQDQSLRAVLCMRQEYLAEIEPFMRTLSGWLGRVRPEPLQPDPRSEEHTSELQSRSDLVCRLLL